MIKKNVDVFFFFQAEDVIRDAQESRGLGDVYKRQDLFYDHGVTLEAVAAGQAAQRGDFVGGEYEAKLRLSLIHI